MACVQVLGEAQPEKDREEGQSVAGWVLGAKRKREANAEEAMYLARLHHSAHLLPNHRISQPRVFPCWLTPGGVQGPWSAFCQACPQAWSDSEFHLC